MARPPSAGLPSDKMNHRVGANRFVLRGLLRRFSGNGAACRGSNGEGAASCCCATGTVCRHPPTGCSNLNWRVPLALPVRNREDVDPAMHWQSQWHPTSEFIVDEALVSSCGVTSLWKPLRSTSLCERRDCFVIASAASCANERGIAMRICARESRGAVLSFCHADLEGDVGPLCWRVIVGVRDSLHQSAATSTELQIVPRLTPEAGRRRADREDVG